MILRRLNKKSRPREAQYHPREAQYHPRERGESVAIWIFLAIALHAVLFIAFAFHHHAYEKSLGKTRLLVHAYVYSYRLANSEFNQKQRIQKREPKKQFHTHRKTMNRSHEVMRKQKYHAEKLVRQIATTKLSQGVYNQLLERLHDAIAQHQIYPNNARLMDETGEVKLAFELLPSGNIEKIRIIQSSGYALLDKAAIETIQAITPVRFASHLLRQAQTFSVTVQYE